VQKSQFLELIQMLAHGFNGNDMTSLRCRHNKSRATFEPLNK